MGERAKDTGTQKLKAGTELPDGNLRIAVCVDCRNVVGITELHPDPLVWAITLLHIQDHQDFFPTEHLIDEVMRYQGKYSYTAALPS